jgi:hypothetical protein
MYEIRLIKLLEGYSEDDFVDSSSQFIRDVLEGKEVLVYDIVMPYIPTAEAIIKLPYSTEIVENVIFETLKNKIKINVRLDRFAFGRKNQLRDRVNHYTRDGWKRYSDLKETLFSIPNSVGTLVVLDKPYRREVRVILTNSVDFVGLDSAILVSFRVAERIFQYHGIEPAIALSRFITDLDINQEESWSGLPPVVFGHCSRLTDRNYIDWDLVSKSFYDEIKENS